MDLRRPSKARAAEVAAIASHVLLPVLAGGVILGVPAAELTDLSKEALYARATDHGIRGRSR